MVLCSGVVWVGGAVSVLGGGSYQKGAGKVSDATEVRSDEGRLETNIW